MASDVLVREMARISTRIKFTSIQTLYKKKNSSFMKQHTAFTPRHHEIVYRTTARWLEHRDRGFYLIFTFLLEVINWELL